MAYMPLWLLLLYFAIKSLLFTSSSLISSLCQAIPALAFGGRRFLKKNPLPPSRSCGVLHHSGISPARVSGADVLAGKTWNNAVQHMLIVNKSWTTLLSSAWKEMI